MTLGELQDHHHDYLFWPTSAEQLGPLVEQTRQPWGVVLDVRYVHVHTLRLHSHVLTRWRSLAYPKSTLSCAYLLEVTSIP
jgi:hypothetical protein